MCPHMKTEEVMMVMMHGRTEEIKLKCPITGDERMKCRNLTLRSIKFFHYSKFKLNSGQDVKSFNVTMFYMLKSVAILPTET